MTLNFHCNNSRRGFSLNWDMFSPFNLHLIESGIYNIFICKLEFGNIRGESTSQKKIIISILLSPCGGGHGNSVNRYMHIVVDIIKIYFLFI